MMFKSKKKANPDQSVNLQKIFSDKNISKQSQSIANILNKIRTFTFSDEQIEILSKILAFALLSSNITQDLFDSMSKEDKESYLDIRSAFSRISSTFTINLADELFKRNSQSFGKDEFTQELQSRKLKNLEGNT